MRVNISKTYIPDDDDMTVAKELILNIPEGRVLYLPLTKLFYRVSHRNRSLTLIGRAALLYEFSAEVHQRVIAVYLTIGYKVLIAEGEDNERNDVNH